MTARDKLYAYAGTPSVLPESMLDAALDAFRAEVLAEAKVETVAWLAKKATEQPTWDAAVLASKVDRGAVRAFIGTGHYWDAMDAHRDQARREVLAEIARLFDDRGRALLDGGIMTAADAAELIRQHAAGQAGKDTREGESTTAVTPPAGRDRIVAYRSRGRRLLRRLDHAPTSSGEIDLTDFTEVTSDDLPDGGICTYPDCGRDVLIDPEPAVPRTDRWLRCSRTRPSCPNAERARLAPERGWTQDGRAGDWLCTEHAPAPAPEFFQPGHAYTKPSHGRTVTYEVKHISTAPDGSAQTSFGWTRVEGYDGWTDHTDEDFAVWTEVAEDPRPAHAPSVPGTCARARGTYDWVNGTTPERETPCRPYRELRCVTSCRDAEPTTEPTLAVDDPGMTAGELLRTPKSTTYCATPGCGHGDNVHGPFCFAAECDCADFTRGEVSRG